MSILPKCNGSILAQLSDEAADFLLGDQRIVERTFDLCVTLGASNWNRYNRLTSKDANISSKPTEMQANRLVFEQ